MRTPIKSARRGGAETSMGLSRQVGQKPVRGSRIVLGERWCGELCDQFLVTVAMIDAAAFGNCGDLADFEGQGANGFGLSGVPSCVRRESPRLVDWRFYGGYANGPHRRCATCRAAEQGFWRGRIAYPASSSCEPGGQMEGWDTLRVSHESNRGRTGNGPNRSRSAADLLDRGDRPAATCRG